MDRTDGEIQKLKKKDESKIICKWFLCVSGFRLVINFMICLRDFLIFILDTGVCWQMIRIRIRFDKIVFTSFIDDINDTIANLRVIMVCKLQVKLNKADICDKWIYQQLNHIHIRQPSVVEIFFVDAS